MLVTWVTKLYFENGDKNVKLLFCFVKQDRFIPFTPSPPPTFSSPFPLHFRSYGTKAFWRSSFGAMDQLALTQRKHNK